MSLEQKIQTLKEDFLDRDQTTYLRKVRDIQYYFFVKLKEADQYEALGDLNNAVTIYESLVADKCYREKPYERLAIIYSKLKCEDDLRRILTIAINHFTDLQRRQYEYVSALAQKYEAVDALNELIADKGVVKYWFGDIVLYKEYSIIDKFKKRLSNLR